MRVTDDDSEDTPERPTAPADTPRIALDHSFLFVVYDRCTREVLTIGRLANPRVG